MTRQAKTNVTAMITGVSLARIALISSEPIPGHAEDLLGHDSAAEHDRHLQGDQRHHRDQCVAHDVLEHHAALRQTLGARGGDVIQTDHVQHGGAHEAGPGGALEQPKHGNRHDRLPDLSPPPAEAGRLHVGAEHERQPVEFHAEQQDEHDASEEGRQREADHRKRAGDLVKDRIGPRRRKDAHRQGDQQCQNLRGADNAKRRRQALQDQRIDVNATDEGEAPVAVQHRVQPMQVADRNRVIEAELRSQCRLHRWWNGRVGCEFAERIARRKRQDGEQHNADAEQTGYRDEQSPDEIAAQVTDARIRRPGTSPARRRDCCPSRSTERADFCPWPQRRGGSRPG